jgi:ankyrin repeat protein
VKLLGDKLSATEIAGFEQTEEPLLSMAIASPDNLRYLLDKGVAVDSQNDFGKTALFYAIGLNNYPAVEILLQHKADVNHAYKSAEELRGADECVYPELRHTKRTPLMHAAQHADAKMIKLLLDHGAQLKAIDDQAYNAADYAAVAHKPENLAFLKSVGLEEALPEYTPNSTSNSLPIVNRLELSGSVYKLRMAANRPDILFASVAKANKPATEDKNGLYLLSLATPDSPKVIAQFPFMNIADIALSQDGKIAYVMEPLFNGAPAEKKFGLSIVDISDAEKPKL